MKAVATFLAMGGLISAAPAAMAQPQQAQGAHQAGPQGGQQSAQQSLEQIRAQAVQRLAQQPELQQALKDIPDGARNALTKAAQAQGGQLIGVERETHDGTTTYQATIARAGVLYEMEVSSDGKIIKWEPKVQ